MMINSDFLYKKIGRLDCYSCRIKIFISIIVWSIIIFFGLLMMVMPEKEKLQQLNSFLIEDEKKYIALSQNYVQNQKLRIQQMALTKRLLSQAPFLRNHVKLNEVLNQLVELAKENQIKLLSIQLGQSVQVRQWHRQEVNLNMLGNDLSFVHWLWILGQQPWLWSIRQYMIEKKSSLTDIHLQLTIYYV